MTTTEESLQPKHWWLFETHFLFPWLSSYPGSTANCVKERYLCIFQIEVLVYCPLTTRQKQLYQGIKNKISIEDLLDTAMSNTSSSSQSSANSLMNLVMQFRKVCNHPELFERQEIKSGFFQRQHEFVAPKQVYRDGNYPVVFKVDFGALNV